MWATSGVRRRTAVVSAVLDPLGLPDEPGRIGPFVSEYSGLNGRMAAVMIL
jgi:hypothetical protein